MAYQNSLLLKDKSMNKLKSFIITLILTFLYISNALACIGASVSCRTVGLRVIGTEYTLSSSILIFFYECILRYLMPGGTIFFAIFGLIYLLWHYRQSKKVFASIISVGCILFASAISFYFGNIDFEANDIIFAIFCLTYLSSILLGIFGFICSFFVFWHHRRNKKILFAFLLLYGLLLALILFRFALIPTKICDSFYDCL